MIKAIYYVWRGCKCHLANMPEEYLLWFECKAAFPEGELGTLMQIALALKIEGLDGLVKKLKN